MVSLLLKATKTFAARGMTGIALVVLTYYVSRRFGVESAGFVNLVWSILLLVAMFARYGVEYSGVRNLAVHAHDGNHTGAAAFIDSSAGMLLVLLALSVPITLQISGSLFADYALGTRDFVTFGLVLVVFGVLSFIAPLHRGLSRPDASYYFDQGGVAALLLLMLVAVPLEGGFAERFLFALLAASLLLTFVSYWNFRGSYRQYFARPPVVIPRPALSSLREGFPFFLITVSEYFLFWSGLLLLSWLASPETVGVYAVLLRTAQLAVVAMSIINAIISPGLATLQAKARTRRLRSYLRQVWKLNFTLGLLSLVAIALFAPLALRTAGIAADEEVYGAFLLLMLPQALKIVLGPVGQIVAMSRSSLHAQGKFAIGSFVFSAVVSALLIPRFGLNGAAFGYCSGLVLYLLLCLYLIRREHGFFAFEGGTKLLHDCFRRAR